MSFINKLANNSQLDNLTINNQLNVGNEINTKNIVISKKNHTATRCGVRGIISETISG